MGKLELKIRNHTFGKKGLAGPASALYYAADTLKGHRQMNDAIARWLPEEEQKDKKRLSQIRKDLAYTRFYDDISADEYFQYRFQNLSRSERDKFISVRYTNNYMKHKLPRPALAYTSDKYQTYQFFGEFFRRDVILVEGEKDREAFLAFAEKHSEFIVKPTREAHGHGVQKVNLAVDFPENEEAADSKDGAASMADAASATADAASMMAASVPVDGVSAMADVSADAASAAAGISVDGAASMAGSAAAARAFDELLSKAPYVAEELVVQDPEMACFHPASVNTVRLVTVCRDGKVGYLMACIRFGLGDSVIDNGTAGGILAAVDTKTGEIATPAFYLTKKEEFENHPDTGARIFHTILPNWEEMRRVTRQMALMVPGQRIVGWDMAFAGGHWVLIEANSCPGLQPGVGYYKGLREEFFKAVR